MSAPDEAQPADVHNYGRGIVRSIGWSDDGKFQAVIEYLCDADVPDLPARIIWDEMPVQIVPIIEAPLPEPPGEQGDG